MAGAVVSIAQQKGGAGKTTLAIQLGIAWLVAGRRVAMLDIDPQASLFTWFNLRRRRLGDDEGGLVVQGLSGWRLGSAKPVTIPAPRRTGSACAAAPISTATIHRGRGTTAPGAAAGRVALTDRRQRELGWRMDLDVTVKGPSDDVRVARVTTQGSPDFVPEPERIATFDNDGTLWCEMPFYFQMAFAFDRLKEMAP